MAGTRQPRHRANPLWSVLYAGIAVLPGCVTCLQPPGVSYPPSPPICCPLLPPMEGASPPAGEAKPAKDAELPAPTVEPQPIDLATALKLADAQNPEIALARERIREALSVEEQAEAPWLPTLEIGPQWTRHDGMIQATEGEVLNVSRSAIFAGAGAGLNLNLSDALFAPLAARQVVAARQAGAEAVSNLRLLDVALIYLDLLQLYAELAINEETLGNARLLLELTESFERGGKGAPADTARARTEAFARENERLAILGRIGNTSAQLVQILRLEPGTRLRPVEPSLVPIALVPNQLPLPELIALALMHRPELAENRALIAATLERWRAAKMGPYLPNLRLGYGGGGFGGGPHAYVSDFDWRGDASLTAVWQLRNMGFGDKALERERTSQMAQATIRHDALEALVASQVVTSFGSANTRRREFEPAQRAVQAARESFRLNEDRIRRAPEQGRPIELLQAIQALAAARAEYARVVADYDRFQFRLYTALGHPPQCALSAAVQLPVEK